MSLTIRVAVLNIAHTLPQGDAAHDLGVAKTLDLDVLVGSEIKGKARKALWRKVLAGVGLVSYLLARETPIATRLPVAKTWADRLHRGYARLTPSRWNARLRTDTKPSVLIVGKHMISGAWRKGANAARTSRIPLRQHLWKIDFRLTRARVRWAVRRGVTVVIVGDLNTLHLPEFHPDQVVAAHHGLMWIIVIPGKGAEVSLGQRIGVPESQLKTDHPIVGRELTVS